MVQKVELLAPAKDKKTAITAINILPLLFSPCMQYPPQSIQHSRFD